MLDRANFTLEAGERVGLIGRNGTGKSSLLQILYGRIQPDDGSVQRTRGLRVGWVAQEPVLPSDQNIFDAVSEGLAPVIALRREYEQTQETGALDRLQTEIEALGGWNWEARVQEVVSRLELPRDAITRDLSGGMRKRLALAQGLVAQPDVLLLDEPTNHLDIDSIQWLEQLLLDYPGSVVTITHDRSFLNRIATRIVELDRGQLRSYPGNYERYRELKDEQLAQESVLNAKADKLLAQEEQWIRRGVEARRTRSQSRINRLEVLRTQREQRRNALGNVKLAISAGDRSAYQGKIVAELSGVSKRFGGKVIAQDVGFTILKGDKVGIVGSNGVGKSTLLKMILGEVSPDSGTIQTGQNLQVAYFDQLRDALDLDATLEDFISPGSEWIEIGKERKHVRSYLGDFLFDPARARSPVRSLSGGERNRLLLARLFARPANVLVLDEPTNDLDIETLELLEELLAQYQGTLFLVSHDRAFVDQVVTSVIAHEGPGQWTEYEGGLTDWLTQSARRTVAASAAPRNLPVAPPTKEMESAPAPRRKPSYKEQRELEELPARIEALENEQRNIHEALADGSLFATDHLRASQLTERLQAIEEELLTALERWTALEELTQR
ncbi:ATP-binding cassette domain-containing protein [Acidovorax lacteus]|uniref:ATP-binding protein Uup n=1 Tax=Acidovorax lacteus TaxID=1924988 RepID=A0ABP8KVR6_9BURK